MSTPDQPHTTHAGLHHLKKLAAIESHGQSAVHRHVMGMHYSVHCPELLALR